MIATRPDRTFWHSASEFSAKPARSLENAPGETSMTNGNGAPPEAAPPPQLNVLAQYTKDLSFENPNAPASLAPQTAAAGDQYPDQRHRQQRLRKRIRGDAVGRGQGGKRRQGDVQLRPRLCRRVPDRERAEGKPASAGHDRMPAAAVPVRARDHRDFGARRRVPAADARSGRFRRSVSPEHGTAGCAQQAKPS